MNTWRDVYKQTFQHAIEGHFNTLDLRELPETKGWTERANDLVEKFIIQGGYRIYPCSVSLPVRAKAKSTVLISHEWKNTGNLLVSDLKELANLSVMVNASNPSIHVKKVKMQNLFYVTMIAVIALSLLGIV